jgi:membrane-bound lytic murein transglycosylase F
MEVFPAFFRCQQFKILLTSALVLVLGCSRGEPEVLYSDPIYRSWSDIKREGVLRMITRYNSSSYFIHRGVERGFDYELLREFCRTENLVLEVVVQQENVNLIDHLNRGDGDVIAAHYAVTSERTEWIAFSTPYEVVNERVVASAMVGPTLTSLSKLEGMTFHVRKGSSGEKALRRLKDEQNIRLNIITVGDEWDSEALMLAVNNGQYEATVSDENLYQAAAGYLDNIAAGPILQEGTKIAFGLRRNDDEIRQKLNRFLDQHVKEDPKTGKVKRSAFFSGLVKRYYEDQRQISSFKQPLQDSPWAGSISPYDKLVQPIAAEFGLDWKLIISMIAQESLFNPQAKSWAGAVGLMQVMPKSSKYSEVELLNPETNIREGIRIFLEGKQAVSYLAENEQINFALAAYNSGVGHLNDARRLTIDQRKNPNRWDDVADSYLKLMEHQYYEQARYGFCRGIETVRYVREVQNRYQMYVSVLNLAEQGGEISRRLNLGFMQQVR